MIFIIAFSTFLSLTYAILIVRLYKALSHLETPGEENSVIPTVSILIPFRNEAERLPIVFRQVEALDYPCDCFELILVDDHSEDNSAELASYLAQKSEIKARVFQLSKDSGKKAALQLAIEKSCFDFVLQTDADCHFGDSWLRSICGYLDDKTSIVIGGVRMDHDGGIWSGFSAIEYMSLQAVTAAFTGVKKPILASGANLLYRKELWSQANVNTGRYSGDDTFLIQHAGKNGRIKFATDINAQVNTVAPDSLLALLNQRARWGGKSFSYPSLTARMLAFFIAVLNLQLLLVLVLSLYNSPFFLLLGSMLIVKSTFDYIFLRRYARLTHQGHLMNQFWFSMLFYPIYIALTGLWILFGRTEWKGRRFRPATD